MPWQMVIRLLTPVVWAIERLSDWIRPNEPIMAAPEEEVLQMAHLSAEEGSILALEARLVQNALRLDEITAEDVMTPRTVVFKLPGSMTLREVGKKVMGWHYSRIPVHQGDNPEAWTGFVRTRAILSPWLRIGSTSPWTSCRSRSNSSPAADPVISS